MNILSQADGILAEAGVELTRGGVMIIAADIREVIDSGEQFTEPDEIGSELTGALALTRNTVQIKQRQGAPYPLLPRYRFGSLRDSIEEFSMGGMESSVVTADPHAFIQQNGEGRIPARPFFGISDRALQRVETKIKETETKIIQRLESVQLEPVDVTVNV